MTRVWHIMIALALCGPVGGLAQALSAPGEPPPLTASPGSAQPARGDVTQGDAAQVDSRRQLERILSGDQYQRWKLRQERLNGKLDEGPSAFRRWLEDLLDRWWPTEHDGWRGPPKGIGAMVKAMRTIGWLILGAAVVMLGWLGYRVWKQRKPAATEARVLSREHIREAMEKGDAMAMASPDWMREADRLLDQNEFRAVYRALYLSLLAGLHGSRKIDYRKNRTNWNYVQQYRGGVEERQTFTSLTRLFDDVWYGYLQPAKCDFPVLRRQIQSLVGDGESAHA